MSKTIPIILVGLWIAVAAQSVSADESPAIDRVEFKDRTALFGELHVHSSNSYDSAFQYSGLDPKFAYKFGRGEAVPFGSGTVRINQPLDFMAVTDHAMYLGVIPALRSADHVASELPFAKRISNPDKPISFAEFSQALFPKPGSERQIPLDLMNTTVNDVWASYPELAEKYYEPGVFTTLVGYEWTSAVTAQGLHRNIIFRGVDVPEKPFSALDSVNPEDLWAWMDSVRQRGIQLLAIPHNPNQSNGLMFSNSKWDGSPIDLAWAETRMRNEPLVEVTQVKGTSETLPSLSPGDEWADFEIMDERMGMNGVRSLPVGSYVRQAYLDGIALAASQGINPYAFGLVGATDGHNAVSTAEESNYLGKMSDIDGTREERRTGGSGIARHNWSLSASGLAGVWAEENTREHVFDALARKEAFATSGTRLKVRLFASWGLPEGFFEQKNWPEIGYSLGVPMGGELPPQKSGREAPQFAIWALKDPASAGIQRLQVIKGWVDADGESHERVIDVACSDGGTPDSTSNRCPDNGASVSLETCDYSRDKGNTMMNVVWEDADFDPKENAFYYARVLENPTCRWSTWDAIRMALPPLDSVSPTLQERAWSSPIWYSPSH